MGGHFNIAKNTFQEEKKVSRDSDAWPCGLLGGRKWAVSGETCKMVSSFGTSPAYIRNEILCTRCRFAMCALLYYVKSCAKSRVDFAQEELRIAWLTLFS